MKIIPHLDQETAPHSTEMANDKKSTGFVLQLKQRRRQIAHRCQVLGREPTLLQQQIPQPGLDGRIPAQVEYWESRVLR
jgi:hypothetical protein